MRVITSANKEMSEEVLKKYREKKNRKNENFDDRHTNR